MIKHHRSKVMRRFKMSALALLTAAMTFPVSGWAASPSPSQAHDPIQTVVARQLSAFKARDSAQAYSVISNSFRAKYKTPLRFSTMVRLNFWELYNHAAYRFLGQNHTDQSEIQKVEITGEDHLPYVYLFRLSKSESGEWLIDDVIMLDPAAQAI